MRVLSLDLATTTGWALAGGGVVTSGSQCFARHAGNKTRRPDHHGEPFAQFHRWLSAKLAEDKPEAIACEGVGFFKSAFAAEMCIGLRGVMLGIAASRGIPVYNYAPSSVKLFWTGSGRADKAAMVAATRRRLPDVDLSDANEADALAILHLHASKAKQTPPAAPLTT